MDDLSIIIPVNSGDESWIALCTQLLKIQSDFEIILVGPDFKNRLSQNPRQHFFYSERGRAKQQNVGGLCSSKNFLWFLHADSVLSKNALKTIEFNLKNKPNNLFFFDLKFLSDGPKLMPLNSCGTYLRSHFFKMPFGDQGFFLSKKTFFNLGLFNEAAAYGEDHLLVWKAHQKGVEVVPCNEEIYTSSRKYANNGWLKTTSQHVFLTYKQAFPELIKMFSMHDKKKKTKAIAIFVKTPGLSSVKSRLAAKIGKEDAEHFFHLSIKATQRAVIEAIKKSFGDLEPYWAIAEEEALNFPIWGHFKTISQGEGSLGERLAKVYSTLEREHSGVFLIGADLPHIDFQVILKASEKLTSSDKFVLGETEDGGFYLFGGSSKIEKSIWTSIEYSSEKTAFELKQILGKENFIYLDKNFDIDFVEDLQRLADYDQKGLLPEQVEVIHYAQKLFRHS